MQKENHNYNYSYNSHYSNVVSYQIKPQGRNNLNKPKELQRKPISDERKEIGDLKSMPRKISTRFFLTMCDPDMEEENVKKYISDNFPGTGEIYARKLQMSHEDYSSFIFFTNTSKEVNVADFKQHKWPGVIKCFFAPRDRNWRY